MFNQWPVLVLLQALHLSASRQIPVLTSMGEACRMRQRIHNLEVIHHQWPDTADCFCRLLCPKQTFHSLQETVHNNTCSEHAILSCGTTHGCEWYAVKSIFKFILKYFLDFPLCFTLCDKYIICEDWNNLQIYS